jgi:hypothetical protein
VADLERAVNSYFESLEPSEASPHGKPATLTGLSLHLDTFPDVLRDYESGSYDDADNKFSSAVKKARNRVIAFAEQALYTGKNAAGPIFHLCNLTRHAKADEDKWKNAQAQEVTGANGGPLDLSVRVNWAESK